MNHQNKTKSVVVPLSLLKRVRTSSFVFVAAALIVSGFFVSVAYAAITNITLTDPLGEEEWRGTQNITWTYTDDDNNGGPVSILLSSDGGSNYNNLVTGVPVSNPFFAWDTTGTPDSSTYKIKVVDPATSLAYESANDFMVDNTAPVTTEFAAPLTPDGLNDWYTTAPTITLSCDDGTGSGCLNTYYDWDNITPTTVYGDSFVAAEGEHALSYFSEDEAVDSGNNHNQEGVTSTTYKVDTTFPTVAVTSATVDGAYNELDDINVTLTFSEPVWSTDTLTVNLDTGGTCSVPALTNETTGTCTYTVGAGHTSPDLTVTSIDPVIGVVEDIAGNDSTLSPISNIADTSAIVIDTTAPIAFITGNVTPSGGTVVAGWWNSTNTGVDVLVPIDDDASLTGGTVQLQVEADGTYENVGSAPTIDAAWLGTTISRSLTSAELEAIAGFSEGDNLQFRAVITDIAENMTTGTQSAASLDVDETAPTVNAGTDKEVNTTVAQEATTSDGGSGIATWLWTFDAGLGTVNFTSAATEDTDIDATADGIYTVHLTVTDVAGNSATDDINFAWDTIAPMFAEVTPVKNPTNDPTPDYEFSVDSVKQLAGSTGEIINYAGSCTGTPNTPVDDNNTVTLDALVDGTYTDCDITVTDAAGNTSATLEINDFEVDTIAATILSVTTEDTDFNGSIDKATLVFDDEIDDSTILLTDFAIGGTNPTAMTTGTANDDTIVFTFGTQIAGTEAKTLDYTSSADDLAGNDIAPFSELSIDEAGPVMLSARTITTTRIDTTWSENIEGATVNDTGTEFTVDGFAVSDADDNSDNVVELIVATMPTDATPNVTFTNIGTFTDLNGVEAVTPVTVTAVDEVAPVLTSVSIVSNNVKDTELAKEGDTITVSLTTSEAIASPTMIIQGVEATTVLNPSGNNWTASRVMTDTDTEGLIALSIDFEDVVVPPNTGVTVTSVTDASSVFYDRTDPIVDAGIDREVNAPVTPQGASTSDPTPASGVDTYVWTDVGPGTVTYSNQSGTGTDVDTNISADTEGTYTITLTVEDEAGNIASDEMTFIWDTTNPVQEALIAPDPQTDVPLTAGTAKVRFDENIVLLDASRVLLVDNSGTSHKGTVVVDGGDGTSAILNIDYTGLAYGTTYDVIVKPNSVSDVAGNNVSTNFTAQFTTEIDTVVPVVNSFSASDITTTGATLNVTTNESATCSYATTDSAYASMTAFTTTGGTAHTEVFTGLSSSTGYDYFVRCADTTLQTNTMTTSAHVSFTTIESVDTTAPVIVLLGQNPLTFTEGDTYVEYGATASDDVDGDISGDIEIDDSDVDMNVAGTYTVTYDVDDVAGNSATQVTRTVVVEAAFDDTAPLAVTGIDAVKTYATADDTYENGWSWTFHVTVPTDETEFAMKFADFVSGGDTIVAADNIRFYSAQSFNSYDTSTATAVTAANTYSTVITLDTDLESGTPGRQIEVTVEMKVPTGSAGGSYSAQYGVKSE